MLRRLPLLAALSVLFAALPAAAQSPAPVKVCRNTEKTISIDVANADLQPVVAMLERQTNIQALVQDGDKPYHPISVHMNDAPIPKALRAIALSAGAQVTKNASGVYVFAPADAVNKAQTPINAASLKWHKIVLLHVNPADIVKRMNWIDTSSAAENPNLPDGVARILALQGNNSLLVNATDEGFQQVKAIVKRSDIAPRQVQSKTLFAAIPISQKLVFNLNDALGSLLQLQKAKATFYQPLQVTSDNNSSVDLPIQMRLPYLEMNLPPWRYQVRGANRSEPTPTLHVAPRINSDNTVTLEMNLSGQIEADFPAFTSQPLNLLRTVASGGLIGYEVTGLPDSVGYRVFLFVTPTIISEINDSATANADGGQSVTVTP